MYPNKNTSIKWGHTTSLSDKYLSVYDCLYFKGLWLQEKTTLLPFPDNHGCVKVDSDTDTLNIEFEYFFLDTTNFYLMNIIDMSDSLDSPALPLR